MKYRQRKELSVFYLNHKGCLFTTFKVIFVKGKLSQKTAVPASPVHLSLKAIYETENKKGN
jgi:hypothetical protein